MTGGSVRPTRAFLRLAAAGALLYVAAQVFQWWVIAVAPVPASPEDAILGRLLPLARARAIIVMASFPAVLLAYAGLALHAFRRSPGLAVSGLVFASMFVAFELAYRAIDVFVVTEHWAPQLRDVTDSAVVTSIVDRIAMWRTIVAATYFPLLLSNALASVLLGVAVWNRQDRWSQALSVLLSIKAAQAAARILEMHAGLAGLSTLNFRIYFPVTIVVYGYLAFWLWRHGERLDDERAHAIRSSVETSHPMAPDV